MAAVTATLNPARTSEILLFYCASDQNVNLSRLTSSSQSTHAVVARHQSKYGGEYGNIRGSLGHGAPLRGTNPAQGGTDLDPTKGLVKNPSCFGWVNWKNLMFVFGIRASDNVICVVSPEFRPINRSPVAASNSLAACGDGKTGWLYYLSDKHDPSVIVEYKLDPGVFVAYEPQPDPNSDLAAYYNPREGKRYCIYQKNSVLQWFSPPDGGSNKITNANNAKQDTPLAISLAGDKAYLFYCTNQSNLCVIIYDTLKQSWGSSTVISDAQLLAASTRLSAITSTDQDQIYVYYIAESDSTVFYEWTYIIDN
jgi:hypothetical protein